MPCEDILDYLAMFADTTEASTNVRKCHPVDLVLEAFKDEETTKITHERLKVFLEEVLKVHGRKLEQAHSPVPCLGNLYWFIVSVECG